METKRIHFIIVFIIFSNFITATSESDADILRRFKQSLQNADALSHWDDNSLLPCNGTRTQWKGVICVNNTIWALQLENMGLGGEIDVDTLGELQHLRAISFRNNSFDGSLPDLRKLGALKSIYLSNNQFSGWIPYNAFLGMSSLKKVYLSNNKFSGPIPWSLATLPRLMELSLKNNEFEGPVPDFPQRRFRMFNVSNNSLGGKIPDSLNRVDASAFSGNEYLCGAPLAPCKSPHEHSMVSKVIVAIVVAAAMAALVLVVVILSRRNRTPNKPEPATTASDLDKMEKGQSDVAVIDHHQNNKKAEQSVKLTFLREDTDKFDMTHLLTASAEILGSGAFGSTYKAALNDAQVMVVKRYKHMNNVSREEFHEHMARLGRLSHPNLLPIVAFYYRKEEKLMVTDFVENVSLAVHLHSKRSRKYPSPDWPRRLKIIKGVANGLKYLYDELPSLTAPHGHLKSSNVLLDKSYNPQLTDYGLVPIVNQEQAHVHMIAYKSPEYKHNNRITKKTDIWSLGILILETLTGRFPSNFLHQGTGSDADIATWVESVLRDESNAAEVFDKEMGGSAHFEVDMMKMLKIGLSCCQADIDKRPGIKEVVEKIDEI